MNLEQPPPGQRTGGVEAVTAQTAGVDPREIRLAVGADRIGDQVAKVGLRRVEMQVDPAMQSGGLRVDLRKPLKNDDVLELVRAGLAGT